MDPEFSELMATAKILRLRVATKFFLARVKRKIFRLVLSQDFLRLHEL